MGRIIINRISNTIELLDAIKGEPVNGRKIIDSKNNHEFYLLQDLDEKKISEIRKKIIEIKKELSEHGITTDKPNFQIKALMYLYGYFQKRAKYANAAIHLGEINPTTDRIAKNDYTKNICNIYGMMIDNYANCAGMSHGMALVCEYFGIPCKVLKMTNLGVIHATNLATINGKNIHFDLSGEIGFTDGLYDSYRGNVRRRVVPLEKTEVSYRLFGKTKSELEKKGKKFWANDVPEGIKIPSNLCKLFLNYFNSKRPVISSYFEDKVNCNVPNELRTSSRITIHR